MAKPEIIIPTWARYYILDPKKFKSIGTADQKVFEFAPPKEGALWVGISRDPLDFPECLALAQESARLQSYIVVPGPYDPGNCTYSGPAHIKVVHTSDLKAAVNYAVGILEKGATYGIWASLNNS